MNPKNQIYIFNYLKYNIFHYSCQTNQKNSKLIKLFHAYCKEINIFFLLILYSITFDSIKIKYLIRFLSFLFRKFII